MYRLTNLTQANCEVGVNKDTIEGKSKPHDEMDEYIETPWYLIESYFKPDCGEKLVQHQIASYNHFINYQLERTISMFNPFRVVSDHDFDIKSGHYSLEILLTFNNLVIYRPQLYENNGAIKPMFPQDARLRNFTYDSSIMIDVNIQYNIRTGENLQNVECIHKTIPKVNIGKMPIMVKSGLCLLTHHKHLDPRKTGECMYDVGGYFIINGSEKTVLAQERVAENKIYCFECSKNQTKYTHIAEIKSIPDNKCISPKQISVMIVSKHNGFGFPIVIQIPRIKQPIPIFTVFRALGVLSDKEICSKILLNIDDTHHSFMLDFLQGSIVDSTKCMTQDDSIKFIMNHVMYTPINMEKEYGMRKKQEFTVDVLNNDLFPHCSTMVHKIYFLGYMINKILRVYFEISKPDDRDSYLNKRIDLTGHLLNNQFRNHFNKLVKDGEKQIIKEINTGSWRSTDDYSNIINNTNIYKIIKSTTISNNLKRALATGDFGIKQQHNTQKVGVAQVLNRLTYISALSHLRRVSTPTDKSGKLIPPRKLHNTSWGYICPSETPEGQSVGVVKNLSYMASVTVGSNSIPIHDYVNPHIISLTTITNDLDLFNKVKVLINGSWVGFSPNPAELYHRMKQYKYTGIINIYTSVIFDFDLKEIRICTDAGRLSRPVLRVTNNKLN